MTADVTVTDSILLVDGDPEALAKTTELLEADGYDVTASSNVEEAREHARRRTYKAAVLELEIGQASGLEFLEELHRINGATRVIVNTDFSSVSTVKRALDLGAFAYLEKADGKRELLRTIESALRSQLTRYSRGVEELVAEHRRSLQESEGRFRDLVETMIDWIWETDAGGRYTYVGPQVGALLGYEPEDLLGRFILEIVPHADFARINKQITAVRSSTLRFRNLEMPLLTKDGRTVIHEMRWVPVVDSRGEVHCFRGIGRDVTEARALEERFRQSQKLDAVGRMAGGIAHDFNNLLTVVLGNTELLVDQLEAGGDVHQLATSALEAAQRGEHLTTQLLAFARQRRVETRDFDLREKVHGLNQMLGRLIGEHITLEARIPEEMWVRADPGQIDQVLVNLAINARDAMEGGGSLTIEAERNEGESSALWIGDERVDSVCLRVSDTGSGIPPENLELIFEPFFSTKSADKGAGLGLSSVYGIVQQAKGDIGVESRLDHGTTFRIILPAGDAQKNDFRTKPAAKRAERGSERILLVEDEPGVRKLALRILDAQGYSVTSFGEPERALAYATTHFDEVDLLVTDMLMPTMVGTELAHRIGLLNEEVRVLFMSGYSEDRVGELPTENRRSFLQKPFTRTRLLEAVHAALDR